MTPLQIDFVSDVACPWCAVGLAAFERAVQNLGADVQVHVRFQPFELNPDMPPGGQDITEHLAQKYGSTPEQQQAAREGIRQRGAAVGFEFRQEGRGRIYNTFDAHRLLCWAAEAHPDRQRDLKMALLEAYHGRGESPEAASTLLAAAAAAGLDAGRAKAVLDSGEYAEAVREQERFWTGLGIRAVPSVVVNRRHLIQGGQPPEVFEQALRQIAAEAQADGDS